MGKTRVVHCKREPYDVLIDRTTKWGNLNYIGRDGRRKDVIAKNRCDLLRDPELLTALPELFGQTLGCWCKPLDCHGDNLAELANKCAAALGYREREILKLRRGLYNNHCRTLEEVGRIFKITDERVRQIEARAMRKVQLKAEAILRGEE